MKVYLHDGICSIAYNYYKIKDRYKEDDDIIGIITPFKLQKRYIEKIIEQQIARLYMIDKEKSTFYKNIRIGTVHTFQGNEVKIILFSSVITKGIKESFTKWINKEKRLINVAVSRAIDLFVLFGDKEYILSTDGIMKELVEYIVNIGETNGRVIELTRKPLVLSDIHHSKNRKPIDNPGEEKITNIISYVLGIWFPEYTLHEKVRVADVLRVEKFKDKWRGKLRKFYYSLSSHFDYTIYKGKYPIFSMEFDGGDHREDKTTIENDRLKNEICKELNYTLIRIPSTDEVNEDYFYDILKQHLD